MEQTPGIHKPARGCWHNISCLFFYVSTKPSSRIATVPKITGTPTMKTKAKMMIKPDAIRRSRLERRTNNQRLVFYSELCEQLVFDATVLWEHNAFISGKAPLIKRVVARNLVFPTMLQAALCNSDCQKEAQLVSTHSFAVGSSSGKSVSKSGRRDVYP